MTVEIFYKNGNIRREKAVRVNKDIIGDTTINFPDGKYLVVWHDEQATIVISE